MRLRLPVSRETLRKDAVAGVVLGVESVPDGLAAGLLAGVSPLSGLYAYLFGTISGSLFTSSVFMAVQATGAMAIIVADVPAVHVGDQARALFTLSVLTGLAMLAAGFLRLGSLLRFVSNAVMVGFISAVGVNIVLGQLANLTGYQAAGANRVVRAIMTVAHAGQLHPQSLAVGVTTIMLILLLERTRLGPLGLVLAVIVTSAATAVVRWRGVATVNDLGAIPRSLPLPAVPSLGLIPSLLIPALSLTFVGLVQGAAISATFPNPDGRHPDASRDFIGQGAANVIAGVFRGMPVGGSMSASSLNKTAGARSRLALMIASGVMALVIIAFAGLVGHIAMPALAGLLMLVGYRTVKPADLRSVWKTGPVQKAVLATTFALTMIIPLQDAVLAGVGMSVILQVVRQSSQVTIKRWRLDPAGDLIETEPPAQLPPNEVVALQPYGSLFFAAVPVLEAQLPALAKASSNSVVILRLRGRSDLGTTFMDVLYRYAQGLNAVGSKRPGSRTTSSPTGPASSKRTGSDPRQHQDGPAGVGGQPQGHGRGGGSDRAHLEALRDRDHEEDRREQHRVPQVPLGIVAGGGALIEHGRRGRVQPRGGLEAWVPVLRHCPGAGRSRRVGKRIGLQPVQERGPVVRCKPTHVERLEGGVAGRPGLQVRGKERDVGDELLTAVSGCRVGLEPVRRSVPVQQRLLAVPRSRLVPAPGGGDRNGCQHDDLYDLDEGLPVPAAPFLPARLVVLPALVLLGQLAGRLDVHFFRHGRFPRAVSEACGQVLLPDDEPTHPQRVEPAEEASLQTRDSPAAGDAQMAVSR